MKKNFVLTLWFGLLPFVGISQISKTQIDTANFTAYPIAIDTISINFSHFDSLNFNDNNVGFYKLISPTSFNINVQYSSLYGKIFDTNVYKKPHPTVKILMSFTLSPLVENLEGILINKLNSNDSLIYEGVIESKYFEDIPPLYLFNIDLKKYIELFAVKRYYLNYINLDIVFCDLNYASVHLYSSFLIKQEIIDGGL
jgi:hypothetical protein